MSFRLRVLVAAGVAVLLALGVTGYVLVRARPPAAGASGAVTLDPPGQLIYRMAAPGPDLGRVASVPQAGGRPVTSGLRCDRFHAAAGTGVCLRRKRSAVPMTEAVVLDDRLGTVRTVDLPGVATRARVSPSGRMVAWTTFVTGDSYSATGFSTRSGLFDTRSNLLVTNMETLQVTHGGKRYYAADVNFWGVTFADDNRFYATMASRGRTYLIAGEIEGWRARTVRENVECPSLSPDGKRLAFKKKVGRGDRPWRLAVLELATMRETELPGTDGIDDQAAWLDNRTVAYGMPARRGGTDLWSVAADGTGKPRPLRTAASSPAST